MQKTILLLLTFSIFIACNNKASTEATAEDTLVDETELLPEERLSWMTVYDTTRNMVVLLKQREVDSNNLTPQSVISDINATWENIKLEFRKVSNDTLYVAIPHSDYLTQQMGSSGSSEYLASATFNLTEIKGVRFVNYDFHEGDHLSPGTFSRDSFKEFR
ncbi:MAG TPA: hypothetical protein VF476_01340 [Chitinophagaceae bacterium]